MTQKEFTDRTGLKVTEEEYRGIEAMYYAVPNMEKDEFCLCFKRVGDNALTIAMTNRIHRLTGMLEERENELDDCHGKMNYLAGVLIEKACAYDDTDLYKEAVRILGERAAVLHKIKKGYSLWREDKEYLRNNLK